MGHSSTRAGLPWTLLGESRPRAASFSCVARSSYQTVRSTSRLRGFSRASGILTARGGTADTGNPFLHYFLLLALLNSSMSFFLFSFHVYEKMILLPPASFDVVTSTAPHDSSTLLSSQECWRITLASTSTFLFSTPRSDSSDFIACGPS